MALDDVTHNPNTKSGIVYPESAAVAAAKTAKARQSTNVGTSPKVGNTGQDRWEDMGKLKVNPLAVLEDLGLENTIAGVEDIINTLQTTIDILTTIGKLINLFQVDLNNLFKVLELAIQAIIQAIEDMLVSLASTGLYALPVSSGMEPFDPLSPAGGGYQKVLAEMNHALVNRSDPNRPTFIEGDYLGALIFVVTAGDNLGDLVKDLSILKRFIQNDPSLDTITPPQSLTATPGLYYTTETSLENPSIANIGLTVAGVKVPGIKLSWGAPLGIPNIDGYMVYRSKKAKGTPILDSNGNLVKVSGDSNVPNKGKPIRKYQDYTFNSGKPVYINNDFFHKMDYTDLEVAVGETYYYKVVPLFETSEPGVRVEGEGIALYTSATASSCIPDDLLTRAYETPDGLLKGLATGEPPHWSNLTLRGLLGESFDTFLRSLTGFTDRLKGITVSSNVHFNDFLELLDQWITKISDLLQVIKDVLEALKALQFSSNVMMLRIPAEYGGIQGLRSRINQASFPEELKQFLEEYGGTCNVYGGLMFVVGSPTSAATDKIVGVTKAEGAKIKQAGNLENYKAQQKAEFEELYQNAEARSREAAETTMNLLDKIFGGA